MTNNDHGSHTSHGYQPGYSTLLILLAAIAAFLIKGCAYPYPPPVAPIDLQAVQPQPVVTAPAQTATYANPPTAGVPYGSMVVTPYGGIIPRYAPIPNHYEGGPGEAAVRAQGEAIAQSDYAGVAAVAPGVPRPTSGGSSTGTTGAPGSVERRLDAVEEQQLDTHGRLRTLERRHH